MEEGKSQNGFSAYFNKPVKIVYRDGAKFGIAKGFLIEIFQQNDRKFLKIKHPRIDIPVTINASDINKIEPWEEENG